MRNCQSCIGRCTIISTDCLKTESDVFGASGLEAKKLRNYMNKAQRVYIIPMITQTCFDALCTAINNSELEPSEPDYMPLTPAWENIIENLTPVLVAGAEYVYLFKTSYGQPAKAGFKINPDISGDNWKEFKQTLKVNVETERQLAIDWLSLPENRIAYPCLPAINIDQDCEPLIDDFQDSWTTTSPRVYSDRHRYS